MALTLLQIVQTAADELGLPRPAAVVTAVDPQVRQLLALTNRDGRELQQNYEWTALQSYFIVNVGVPVSTTGNLTQQSAVVTGIPDTSGIVANYYVCTGNAIPVAARVVSVDSPTQVTLDTPATDDVTAATLVFAKDTYAKPADFDRFINQTWWDRTNRWMLLGPDSPQIDEWHRSGVVTTGPRRHFRMIGYGLTTWRFWPPPSTLDTPIDFVTEYISKNWVLKADGTTTDRFQADTDTSLIDDEALILGIKWRMWQIKGFDYAAMQVEYKDYCDRHFGQDGGAKTLSLARTHMPYLISPWQAPDGYWPGRDD